MKQPFRKLLKKMKLHITIVLNVFIVYYLLHKLLLGRKEMDLEELMHMIESESMKHYALSTIGLHQSKRNVHIKGRELLG